jgi:hypothetical protein
MNKVLIYTSTFKEILNFYKKFLILNLKILNFKYTIINSLRKTNIKLFKNRLI